MLQPPWPVLRRRYSTRPAIRGLWPRRGDHNDAQRTRYFDCYYFAVPRAMKRRGDDASLRKDSLGEDERTTSDDEERERAGRLGEDELGDAGIGRCQGE
jgi:hypothetical protein